MRWKRAAGKKEEQKWKERNRKKNITFKEYETLVYFNLASIILIFVYYSRQYKQRLDQVKIIGEWAGSEIMLEQPLKSYNSIKV